MKLIFIFFVSLISFGAVLSMPEYLKNIHPSSNFQSYNPDNKDSISEYIDTISVVNLKNKIVHFPINSNKNGFIVAKYSYFCGPCLKQLEFLSNHKNEWESKYGLVIIPVTYEYHGQKMKTLKRLNKNYPELILYIDKNYDLSWKIYFACSSKKDFRYSPASKYFKLLKPKIDMNSPSLFFINSDGKVIYSRSGYSEEDQIIIEQAIDELFKND